MVSLYTSVRLLRLKQYELNHTTDVDCIKINNKYCCNQGRFTDAKNRYFQNQCSKCENQGTLQKNIHCIDKLFQSYKCLYMSWDVNQPLILFFSNGSIVNIDLNNETNTLLKIDIDENLCGKFLASRIVDVVVCKNYIYVSYVEPKFTLVQINKDSPPLLAKMFGKKKGKIVGFEPKIFNFDLSVHSPKPAERKLSINKQKDLLLVWWKNSGDDVWPWTPITFLTDRLNLFIYTVNGSVFELLCSVKVQNELLHATFSREHSYKFFTLEETKEDNEVISNVSIYEITEGHCQIVHSAKLPVNGRLIAFDWSSAEDKLLASDSSGFLIIYDVKTQSSMDNVCNLKYLPLHIAWHPQACIAIVVCRNNHIFCVDVALNLIDFKLCYKTNSQSDTVNINSFFSNKFAVQKVVWQKSAYNDTCLLFLNPEMSSFVLLKISFGYITRHNITSLELISQYLKCNEVDRAKFIYLELDWEFNSDIKFQCLSKIINYLFRRPLNYQIEGALVSLLGSFYRWIDNIPRNIIAKYEPRIYHLTRRFFHRLLRYNKFEKAWSLALDLESQDLFLDLYQIAKQKDQNILAGVALHHAEQYESPVTDSSSESCQSDSSSESDSSSYIEYQNKKMDKWAAYRKMHQDLLDSDKYKDLESYSDRSKMIDDVFKTLNINSNPRVDSHQACSDSLKHEIFCTENHPDLCSEYSTGSTIQNNEAGKVSSKHSIQHLPYDKPSYFYDFSLNSKYATSPLNNILHHKNSQEVLYETHESENACSSSKAISDSSYKNSTVTSRTAHDNHSGSDRYKGLESFTEKSKRSEPFQYLSMNTQSNPDADNKKVCSYSLQYDTFSTENISDISSKHSSGSSIQNYEAKSLPNLSLEHSPCNKHAERGDSKYAISSLSNSGQSKLLHHKNSVEIPYVTQEPVNPCARNVTGISLSMVTNTTAHENCSDSDRCKSLESFTEKSKSDKGHEIVYETPYFDEYNCLDSVVGNVKKDKSYINILHKKISLEIPYETLESENACASLKPMTNSKKKSSLSTVTPGTVDDNYSDSDKGFESFIKKSKRSDVYKYLSLMPNNNKSNQNVDCKKPCSYSLQHKTLFTENISDISSKHSTSSSMQDHKAKSSNLSSQHPPHPYNKHSESGDSKYATSSPLSHTSQRNLLHNKNSLEILNMAQESGNACASVRTETDSSYKKSSLSTVNAGIVHDNCSDFHRYKGLESFTEKSKRSEPFKYLSIFTESNPNEDSKNPCSYSLRHKTFSTENLSDISSIHTTGSSTQYYKAKSLSNLALEHPPFNKHSERFLHRIKSLEIPKLTQEPGNACSSVINETGSNFKKSRVTTGTIPDENFFSQALLQSHYYSTKDCGNVQLYHPTCDKQSDCCKFNKDIKYSHLSRVNETHSETLYPESSQVIPNCEEAENAFASFRCIPGSSYKKCNSSRNSENTTPSLVHVYNNENCYKLPFNPSPFSKISRHYECFKDQTHTLFCNKDDPNNLQELPSEIQESDIASEVSKSIQSERYKFCRFSNTNFSGEPHVHSGAFISTSKTCDIRHSNKIKSSESCITAEENEEVEGTKIKLAHLGII